MPTKHTFSLKVSFFFLIPQLPFFAYFLREKWRQKRKESEMEKSGIGEGKRKISESVLRKCWLNEIEDQEAEEAMDSNLNVL